MGAIKLTIEGDIVNEIKNLFFFFFNARLMCPRTLPESSAPLLFFHTHQPGNKRIKQIIICARARVCVCVGVCVCVAPLPHKSRSSAERGPIWKTSDLNEVVQNRPVDNKANFYGSDKCVIMCSGAFQILSQSINYGANFIPVLTYLHGNIRFGVGWVGGMGRRKGGGIKGLESG